MPYNSFDDYPMSWRPTLTRDDAKPLYIALAEMLERDIANGTLKAGTKLPPQRELADFLDVNVSTVARAFKICSNKGLLNGTVGSGTFVSYHITSRMELAPHSIIDMGSIMPDIADEEEMRLTLRELLDDADFSDAFQYLQGTESWQRNAGARLLARVKCSIAPDDILFASGGQNAIAGILLGVFKAGDRLGVDPLVYSGVITLASLLGIRLVPIEQENGEMSEQGILRAIKNDGIKGLYIIPNCQNPTMHRMSEACRSMIARLAEEHNLIVIEDGFSGLLTDQQDVKATIYDRVPEHGIFLLSLSKSISPALRQSYIAAGKAYRTAIGDALYNINLDQSALLMEIAARLVLSGRFETLIDQRKQILKERNRMAEEILGAYCANIDENALCKWVLLPEGLTGAEFERQAAERQISVYGAEHFAVGKNAPVSGARLAISTPKTAEDLQSALYTFKEILDRARVLENK